MNRQGMNRQFPAFGEECALGYQLHAVISAEQAETGRLLPVRLCLSNSFR